jgi:antitoxin HicB
MVGGGASLYRKGELPMRRFVYLAKFERGQDHGIVVSFPDVPEAITEGGDAADAYAQAEEALGLALLTYPARGLPLPEPRTRGADLKPVVVEPEIAAKLAVIETVRQAGITKSEFARRIGKDEKEARRILNPRHATKLSTLTAALREMGQRLVIDVEPANDDRMTLCV